MIIDSTEVAKASAQLAMASREDEKKLEEDYKLNGILTAAVDIGGNINTAIPKIIERALVASKKCGLITDCHVHDGAVAGATRDALMQLNTKANGLNFGGKIGIARCGEHLSVCIFMSIGLLHLNEVAIAIGHRSIPNL